MSIVTVFGARGQRNTLVRQVQRQTFDAFIATFAANLISYWKFSDATGTDEEGQENATFVGSPAGAEIGVPTIVEVDTIAEGAAANGTCIAWLGTAGIYAEAAHDAAHKTANGTIVVYFQQDAAAVKSRLVMADSTSAQGGISMAVNINGSPEVYLRGVGGTQNLLVGDAGDVLLNQAYCLIFKWGSGGMGLSLFNAAGALLHRVTNSVTTGMSGTSPIRFGANHSGTENHNGPYARVVWLDRAITISEENAFGAYAKTVDRSAGSYRAVTLALNPISLWGLGEAAGTTITDAVGARHGTYSGTIGYSADDLPTNALDGAIDFAGTGSGMIPHSSGLVLPAFSISFWFRLAALPALGEIAVLVAKDLTGLNNGDFHVRVTSFGSIGAQFQSATEAFTVTSNVDMIVADTTYHVAVRASSIGFDLFLDGHHIGRHTGFTGAWSANTQPIFFGTAAFAETPSDVIIDEIALFNRFLTDGEVLQLAQAATGPVATNDSVTVLENAVTAIDVVANDTFIGTKANLNVEIMSQPSGGDSVAVNADKNINYTAGSAGSPAGRSFTYRITDPIGTSNTATVDVLVQDIADAYGSTVSGITGLVAHWRLSSNAAVTDSAGSLHGTYGGTGHVLGAGLPTNSDGSINFAGTATGTVAHNAILALASFTLSFWFRLAALPTAGTSAVLVGKDGTGLQNGDFHVRVNPDGSLTAQFQSATASFDVTTDTGAIALDTTYHVLVRGNNTGFEAFINTRHVNKNTGYTSALTPNARALTLATAPFTTALANVVLDEVAIYNRVVTDAELVTLAQHTVSPVANSDNFNVIESATTILDVVANDSFAGTKSNLTVTVMSQPGGGDSATVRGDKDIDYAAVGVGGATNRSFTYRITDPVGNSNTTTVSVLVQDVSTDVYASSITGLTGLLAYWRLGDTSSAILADSSGNGRTGTYPIAPAAFNAGSLTWQASDARSVNFGGVGYGQVTHNAAFATARGTLCGYFRANALADPVTFVNKGTTFVLQALASGAIQLTMGTVTIASQAGVIEPGIEYHIAVCWDQVAIWLLVDGHVVVWSRLHTAGMTANTSNWQFGRTTAGVNSNVRADEIALYSRRLTWEELWSVSEFIAGLPYHPTFETSEVVNTTPELIEALTQGGAAPGHHILVAQGTYNGVNCTIPAARSGTKRHPIVVRPQSGPVNLPNRNITFNNRWMVFDGFNSTSGTYIIGSGARYIRITRNTLQLPAASGVHIFSIHGRFNRLDHNDVSNVLAARRPYHFDPNAGGTASNGFYNLIDHAHTRDSPAHAQNGGPAFGLGTSGADRGFFIATMMYRNLFTNYFVDDEVVTTKSKGNIFIKNTVNCPGGGGSGGGGGVRYPGRLGNLSWVESEYWVEIGTGSGNAGAGFFGDRNVIIGCHLAGGRGALRTGNIEGDVYGETTFYEADPAPNATRNLVIGQTIGSGTLGFIVGHQSAAPLNVPVRDTIVEASPGVSINSTWAVNTTVNPTARIPFTPAVQLSAANVGPAAADPLVPSGYR